MWSNDRMTELDDRTITAINNCLSARSSGKTKIEQQTSEAFHFEALRSLLEFAPHFEAALSFLL
jgi:hypothetical protein